MGQMQELGQPEDLDGLLPRMKVGDEEAWQAMFAACHPKVMRTVRRELRSRALRPMYDSTDFAADVWKSIAGNLSRYQFPNVSAFIAFLVREAECKVRDASRRHNTLKRDRSRERRVASYGESEEGAGTGWQIASPDPTPSQVILAGETGEEIVSGLSEAERKVIELKMAGHKPQEIADMTGWHVRQVQRLLQKVERVWRSSRTEVR